MKKLVVIAGPTASGKTSVSILLASHFKSEIVNADSRQFYRRMNIGTAKPTDDELKIIPHHFISCLNPDQNYNAGQFEIDAIDKLKILFQKHDILFLTGGSGLYIDAVCNGVDDLPKSNSEIRNNLNLLYKEKGIEVLQQKVSVIDPEYYSEADIQNPHRLIRALEVFMISGKKFSSFRKKKNKIRDFEIKKIGLLIDRDELYERINNRVDEMIENGLVDEVKSLLPYRNENALHTVGYKELIEFLDNKTSLKEAIELIKQNTRNYAKRQMTWFRRDQEMKWFSPDETEQMIELINR